MSTEKIPSYKVNSGIKKIPNIKNILAIASGKGGVGKSTVTVNLALSLQEQGAKVGILDADIYGPSIPNLLGIENTEKPISGDKFHPIEKFSLATLSIGYLVSNSEAAIWRGPIVSNTLMQMLTQTTWPELDFLIIDLPPGTGDIQLTLAKKIPVTAAIVVTTPQSVATKIAAKAITMFNKLNIPVLGIVENMGPYVCKNCGSKEHIFGSDGGSNLAKLYDITLLGQIPLDYAIMSGSDSGNPVVIDETHIKDKSPVRNAYINLAIDCLRKLSNFEKDLTINHSGVILD